MVSGLSERSLDDLDDVAHHRGDVEADLPGRAGRVVLQPAGGQSPHPGLLVPGHGLDRQAEGVAGTALDLAEHEGAGGPHDEVELAVAAPPVPGHHLVPPGLVPGRDGVLPCDPERPAGLRHVALPQSSFSGSSSTFTSLNVTTRTDDTKRAGRYISHTHASPSSISNQVRDPSPLASIFTSLAR